LLQLIEDSLKDKPKNKPFQLEKLPFDHLLHHLDVARDVDSSNLAASKFLCILYISIWWW
jgi:hypothetical protein